MLITLFGIIYYYLYILYYTIILLYTIDIFSYSVILFYCFFPFLYCWMCLYNSSTISIILINYFKFFRLVLQCYSTDQGFSLVDRTYTQNFVKLMIVNDLFRRECMFIVHSFLRILHISVYLYFIKKIFMWVYEKVYDFK